MQDQLQAAISELSNKAVEEERSGCFGRAEQYWLQAKELAHKHCFHTRVHAEVLVQLASFFVRFIPESKQVLRYFSEAIEASSEPREQSPILIDIAKYYITRKKYDKAENELITVIKHCESLELKLRARIHLGRVEMMWGNNLKAEQLLKECLDETLGGVLAAEALTYMGELLIGKGELEAGEHLLLRAFAMAECNFFETLKVYSQLHTDLSQYSRRCAVFEDLLKRSDSPYFEANARVCWADAHQMSLPEEGLLHYLQALHLYRSVEPCSWYVAITLQKLKYVNIRYSKAASHRISKVSDEQLRLLFDALPSTSSMLAFKNILSDLSTDPVQIEYTRKLWEVAHSYEDADVVLEVLKRVSKRHYANGSYFNILSIAETISLRFPSINVTEKLQRFLSVSNDERLRAKTVKYAHQHRHPLLLAELLRKIAFFDIPRQRQFHEPRESQQSLELVESKYERAFQLCNTHAPISQATANVLLHQARFYKMRRQYSTAKHYYKRALSILRVTSPALVYKCAFEYANVLQVCGKMLEAESLLSPLVAAHRNDLAFFNCLDCYYGNNLPKRIKLWERFSSMSIDWCSYSLVVKAASRTDPSVEHIPLLLKILVYLQRIDFSYPKATALLDEWTRFCDSPLPGLENRNPCLKVLKLLIRAYYQAQMLEKAERTAVIRRDLSTLRESYISN